MKFRVGDKVVVDFNFSAKCSYKEADWVEATVINITGTSPHPLQLEYSDGCIESWQQQYVILRDVFHSPLYKALT